MSLSDLKNGDLFSVGVAVAAIGILGFLAFFNNRRSITNKTFLAFSLTAVVWSIFNYASYQFTNSNTILWLQRLVMFSAVWYSFLLYQLFKVFPEENYVFSDRYKYLILPITISVSIITLSPLVFSKINQLAPAGQVSKLVLGPGIIIFGAVVFFLIFSGLFILFRKTLKAERKNKAQFITILTGAAITFVLHLIFNFIFPAFLDIQKFIPLGAVFTFPFAALTAYAIGRHGLLNIKAFAAEILTFFLAVVTLFEVIISEDIRVLILRAGVFSLVLIFGILLIRSVFKEVEQREKLQVLTGQLKDANEKLKELDKLKSEFLSFASHQIKAPLAAIKGFATLVYDGTYGEVSDKVYNAAHKIMDSSDRMIQLVTDFLNVRKIEEGKMDYKFERIDGIKIIRGIVEELKLLALNKNLEFSLVDNGKEAWINADVQRIRQVFQNLIENSIKYTDSGFVKVKADNKNSHLFFSVSDSGHGVSKELLPHLFEEFKRDGREKLIEGTGLGLYIARKIVESHQGNIWAESEGQGKGSTFFVSIPLS